MFAALTKDPFHLTLSQIGDLTPYQVRNILFRPEDTSKLNIPGSPFSKYTEEKDTFWKVWKEWRGLSEEEVAAKWVEKQQQEQKQEAVGKE